MKKYLVKINSKFLILGLIANLLILNSSFALETNLSLCQNTLAPTSYVNKPEFKLEIWKSAINDL
ncbi:MAG: hypothetical protein ACD_79C01497G0004, partial [uncultured bacterium]